MQLEIQPYKANLKNQWDEFIKKSKNGCFLFFRDYMEYHRERFVDASLLVFQNKKLVAVFPANLLENTIYSHQGLTFGGLIYGMEIRTATVISVLNHIIDYYQGKNIQRLIYKTIPYIFHTYPAQEDMYALFRREAQLIRRDVFSVVELKSKLKFSETKRQLVKKCSQHGVIITENTEFVNFWKLLEKVLLRHNSSPTHSLQEIQNLNNLFPGNIRLFEAKLNGDLLAGIVIYDYGSVVHTQYMANSDEGRKIGALDYINHYLLEEVYIDRDYYSFGSSNEDAGRILNEGLIQQKEMMGGRSVAHDFYQIDL